MSLLFIDAGQEAVCNRRSGCAEDDASLTAEDKALARFQKERLKEERGMLNESNMLLILTVLPAIRCVHLTFRKYDFVVICGLSRSEVPACGRC